VRGQSFPADAFDHSAIAEVATLLATAWDPNGQIIRSAASRRNSDSSEPRSYRDNLREMADEVNELDTLRFWLEAVFEQDWERARNWLNTRPADSPGALG
jgi:hypothetical protein